MAFPFTALDIIVEAYLGADPTASSGSWPAPTDLSARLLDVPIRITRGRSPGQRSLQAGACSFVLRNDAIGDGIGANAAGVLTPLLATSPYYPGWDLGVPMRLSVDNVGASPPYRRFRGFAADITAEIVPLSGGEMVSAVRVTLGGAVRRLTQGAVARSPLWRGMRYNIGAGAVDSEYWPMEDGQVSTGFGPAVPGGTFISVTDADFAADDTLPGSSALSVFTATTALAFTVPSAPSVWSAIWYAKFAAAPAARTTLMDLSCAGGDVDRCVLEADATTVYLTGYLNGTSVFAITNSGAVFNGLTGGEWVAVHIGPQGANDIGVGVCTLGAGVATAQSFLSPVDMGTVTDGSVPAAAGLADMAMGHLLVTDGSVSAVTFDDAATANAGQSASDRIFNVLTEEGALVFFIGPDSLNCGPQPIATAMDIMRDAELVDHGVLSESLAGWGLTYKSMAERYNLTADLTVDLATYRVTGGTSGDVLRPVRNDQRIRNEWTIERPGGASATDADLTHQSLRGRYADSAQVNVELDADTYQEASWRVHEGTYDGHRYAVIPLDLGANAADADDLLADWLTLDLGDRIDRINHPDLLPPETASVTLEGYTETIGRTGWLAQAVAEPFDPWIVGIYADTSEEPGPVEPKRYSPVESLVDASFDSGTDTALDVEDQLGGDDLWSQTADFPFDIRVAPAGHTTGGVRLRVTAISAPTGAVQTMTVDQAPVNGVERTIPAGWQVSLWQPARYAL